MFNIDDWNFRKHNSIEYLHGLSMLHDVTFYLLFKTIQKQQKIRLYFFFNLSITTIAFLYMVFQPL